MKMTTLCYIEKDNKYLMLHRISKQNDINKNKWIGVGGHFEEGESPEDCLLREVYEETGLTLTQYTFRGLITFLANDYEEEFMCLYTATAFKGSLTECNEGKLKWIDKTQIFNLNLWEGDKIFLKLIMEDAPFFSLKLSYNGDILVEKVLNGKKI